MAWIIAVCALLFTIGSFWWINVRRGQLRSYTPTTYAASMSGAKLVVCVPLVLYNSGAAPIVVLTMRLRFVDAPVGAGAVPWQNTREKLPPDPSTKSLAAVFAVAGRTAEQRYVEFSRDDLGFSPPHVRVPVVVEARLAHKQDFQPLIQFTLDVERIAGQAQYRSYSNDPVYD